MTSADLSRILPVAIPLLVGAILLLKPRRPRRVHPGRLWIVPLLAGSGIVTGLYFQPRFELSSVALLIMAIGVGAGAIAGTAHARTLALTRDPLTGHPMARSSPLAVLLLVCIIFARQGLRQVPGIADAALLPAIVDASMLFALALLVSQRVTLWQRVRTLPPGIAAPA